MTATSRTNAANEITIRAKAFTGQGVQTHRVQIEDGTVRVWDSVAGHFTTCHSLTARTQARIAKIGHELMCWRYAVAEQGFTGTFADWQAMEPTERAEYELGAAGIPTA